MNYNDKTMVTIDLKEAVIRELNEASPEIIKEVLDFLLEANKNDERMKKAVHLRKILDEDRELLNRLAK